MVPVLKINIFFTHLFTASGLLWHCNPTDNSRQNSEQELSPRLLLSGAQNGGGCLAGELPLSRIDPVFTCPDKPGRNNTTENPKMREKRVTFKETRATAESYDKGSLTVGGGGHCLPDVPQVNSWSILTPQPLPQKTFPGFHIPFLRTPSKSMTKDAQDHKASKLWGSQVPNRDAYWIRQGCQGNRNYWDRYPVGEQLTGDNSSSACSWSVVSPCCSEKKLKGSSLQPEIYPLMLTARAKGNPPNMPVSYLYGRCFTSNIRTFSCYSR